MLEEDLTPGEKVYLLRRRSKMCRRDFAPTMGLTEAQLSAVESGKSRRKFKGLTIGGLIGPHEHYLILRRRTGWRQKDVAERMGVAVRTLAAMESGLYKGIDRLIEFWGH